MLRVPAEKEKKRNESIMNVQVWSGKKAAVTVVVMIKIFLCQQ